MTDDQELEQWSKSVAEEIQKTIKMGIDPATAIQRVLLFHTKILLLRLSHNMYMLTLKAAREAKKNEGDHSDKA